MDHASLATIARAFAQILTAAATALEVPALADMRGDAVEMIRRTSADLATLAECVSRG